MSSKKSISDQSVASHRQNQKPVAATHPKAKYTTPRTLTLDLTARAEKKRGDKVTPPLTALGVRDADAQNVLTGTLRVVVVVLAIAVFVLAAILDAVHLRGAAVRKWGEGKRPL
jgi:hypothetical protein